MPTQKQLDARLNPTATQTYIPQEGLFRTADTGAIFKKNPDGSLVRFDISTFGTGENYGQRSSSGAEVLKNQYGIDYGSLKEVNIGDYWQQAIQSGQFGNIPGGDTQAYINANLRTGSIADFVGARPATTSAVTVNTQSNVLAPVATGSSAVNPDFFLKQGESIPAYNARIAASNPNLPAPGTTSLTGVSNIDKTYQLQQGETTDAYNTRIAQYNSAKTGTPIGTTTTPPTASGGLTFPTPTGATVADQFNTSLTAQLTTQRAALQSAYDTQIKDKQTQIDALKTKETELQQLQDAGMVDMKSEIVKQTAEKRTAIDLELQRVNDNYNANQTLISEMDALLTTGNQLIKQMQETTGLSSIMSPRIAKTMTDVAARAGVIQAVLAARNDQIGVAQNQLASSLNAISSIYGDQIDYYKGVVSYYQTRKSETNTKVQNLTSDQEVYAKAKIGVLEAELQNTQNTVNVISKAMLDPNTALAYAKSGISLTDSPQQIGQKLATYAYAKEVADTSTTMAKEGYSTSPIAGGIPITITDSQGVQKTWYKPASKLSEGGFTIGDTRYDASGNVVATNPKSTTEKAASTQGSDLTEAATAIANGADPVKVRQAYLADHPTAGASWDNYFQGSPTASKQFLTRDFLKTSFGETALAAEAEKAGFMTKGILGFGKKPDTSAYLDQLVNTVTSYRSAGLSDDEILKLMK